jgi:trans-aconitate 2-methyltransferase
MSRDAWNPDQYERFHDERSRPFRDLLALVRPRRAMRVVDLGCGTGELTEQMHRTLGARETVGVDSSDAMLARARTRAADGLRFERGDIGEFAPGPRFDLVFSNAALHWLPDHAALLRRLVGALREDGQLAVQVPANYDHPSHTVAREVADEEPFRAALGAARDAQPGVLAPEEYAAILDGLAVSEQHVRLQVYAHRLAARDEVVEWTKGTLLTTYERRLSADVFTQFLARYRERLLPRLEDTRPHLFLFKRILMWAQTP